MCEYHWQRSGDRSTANVKIIHILAWRNGREFYAFSLIMDAREWAKHQSWKIVIVNQLQQGDPKEKWNIFDFYFLVKANKTISTK